MQARRGGDHRAIQPRLPYDAEELLRFFAQRAVASVEEVTEDDAYRRSLRLDNGAGVVELRPRADTVDAAFWLDDAADLLEAQHRARAMLDLDADPTAIAAALGPDPLIGEVVGANPGRRVPGHADGPELAIRAVLGQQVTVKAARTQAERLVAACGEPLEQPVGTVTHLFPAPAAVASQEGAAALAMPAARRRAVIGLAEACASNELDLSPGADQADAVARLSELPGIGPWTTSYIAMRALRDPDAFLTGDVAVQRAIERLGADARPRPLAELAERWRPFGSYAVVHLWASLAAARPATVHRRTSQ